MAANDLNRWQGIGHLGRDPEMSYLPTGTGLTKVSIAVNRSFTKNGQLVKETTWINLEFWGKLAEIANTYLHKGSKIYVDGTLKIKNYQKDGQNKTWVSVSVETLKMLGNSGSGDAVEYTQQEESSDTIEMTPDDEIPF